MHTRTLQAALIAGQLMMANVATQVGDDYFAEYQKNPQTGQQELVFTDFIDNGEGAANRLFIKDPDATKDTKYRYGYGGYYYEMEMIPTSFYDEEDFRSKGLSQSQYDKDRREWVFGSGADYSDKGRWKRFTQDLGDSDFIQQAGAIIVSRISKPVGGLLGIFKKAKGERNQTAKPGGTNNPYKHLREKAPNGETKPGKLWDPKMNNGKGGWRSPPVLD